jgi:hypothetical protein
MPCPLCKSRVANSTLKRNIWYCKCGLCNLCHGNGIYLNTENFNSKFGDHWYQRNGTKEEVNLMEPGQSHGGHGWIPDLERVHPFLLKF